MSEIQKMTSPPARHSALRELTTSWAAAEPESLSGWLNENKNHPEFDFTAFQLVRRLESTDPAAAEAWAAQIKDPNLKTKAATPRISDPFASE